MISILTFFICYILPVALCVSNYQSSVTSISKGSAIFQMVTILRSDMQLVRAPAVRYLLESEGILPSECLDLDKWTSPSSPNIGSSCEAKDMLIFCCSKLFADLTNYQDLIELWRDSPTLKIVMNVFINDEVIDHSTLTASSESSIHQMLIDLGKRGFDYAKNCDKKSIDLILLNAETLAQALPKMSDNLIVYMNEVANQVETTNLASLVVSSAFLVISIILFFAHFMRVILKNRKYVLTLFSTISKSDISKFLDTFSNSNSNTKTSNSSDQTNDGQEKHEKTSKKAASSIYQSTSHDIMFNHTNFNEQINENFNSFVSPKEIQKAIHIFREGQKSQDYTLIPLSIVTVLIYILLGLVFYYIYNLLNESNLTFLNFIPQIGQVMNVFIKGLAAMTRLMILVGFSSGYTTTAVDPAYLATQIKATYESCYTSYITLICGDSTAPAVSKYAVEEMQSYFISEDSCVEGNTLHSIYQCYSIDSMFQLFISYLKHTFTTFEKQLSISATLSEHQDAWHIMVQHLYPFYFYPLFDLLNIRMNLIAEDLYENFVFVIILLGIFLVLLKLILSFILNWIQKSIKAIILVLLSIPSSNLMKSNEIINLFNGNFKQTNLNSDAIDERFFDEIVEKIKSVIFVFDKHGTIILKNKIGKQYFDSITTIPKDWHHKKQDLVLTTDSKEKKHFQLDFSQIDHEMNLVILSDIGEDQQLALEIQKETELYNSKLKTIIPRKVFSLFEEGKPTKFMVPSATILTINFPINDNKRLFSNPKEISNIFSSILEISKGYKTISSIETVGNKFIIISGLFDIFVEENHASETAEFGLEILKYFTNKKINLSLGMVTGGPIICGPLETSKPVFEIYGDTLGLSIDISINGVLNELQITRNVYELIYGEKFNIRERGEIELPKWGKLITYLVKLNSI